MEYLDYLNYTLKRLSEKFSEGLILSNLRSEYKELSGEWIDTETQAHFESLYENEYFARIGTTYKHKISPKAKEIVDEFGSLSTYLELCELERNKKENEETEFKKLQVKNLELQNENLQFSQTIRKQEAIIRKLDILTKFIDFLKAVKWVIGFLIAFVLYLLLT